MNYEHEIYKRKNLPQDEWSKIQREPGSFIPYSQRRKETLKRLKREEELRVYVLGQREKGNTALL